ncbi:MAG: transposase [Flavobacteriales bacterium]|nr:transposase [Flavobacteriales bacterium]
MTKAVYSVYGVRMDGERDVLGLFIGDAEGARHWARVLENIKDRG